MGINDDWGYIKPVQILAQTGHIVYNGWTAPMLGWQLYFGALFVKLFGFSFTAVRLSTLIVAMATGYLVERTLIRAGIREWNATLATMTLILSPIFLPLAFSFMTDIPALFCIVLCLYMCLRALQAESLTSTIAWVSFAGLLNAVGGTARQTAWLGIVFMVPSALWLLRRKPRALLFGGLSWAAGIGIVAASMHWFGRQPYAIHWSMFSNRFSSYSLGSVAAYALCGGAELILLLLPVLLMFVGALHKVKRRTAISMAAGSFSLALIGLILFRHRGLDHGLAPFLGTHASLGDYLSVYGLWDVHSIMGDPPIILTAGLRVVLTVATMIGFVGLLSVFLGNVRRTPSLPNGVPSVSWHDLGVILIPFSVAYLAMLASRASENAFYDRYLLPLTMLSLLVLTRYYQERVRPNLPIATIVLTGVFGSFTIAGTHDVFAMYRGYLAAIAEIRSSGLAPTAINGGWEYNGWTEIETVGYVNNPEIRIPRDAYVYYPATVHDPKCSGPFFDQFPAIKPVYALSFDPEKCNGQDRFPPVVYYTWLGPHATSIYIVKYPAISGH
jgi:hypothetical protein